MRRPLFQTSVRHLLLATFWCAIGIGAWSTIVRTHDTRIPFAAEGFLTWVLMIAPFAATGALIGRPLLGLAAGTITVTLFWIVWWFT